MARLKITRRDRAGWALAAVLLAVVLAAPAAVLAGERFTYDTTGDLPLRAADVNDGYGSSISFVRNSILDLPSISVTPTGEAATTVQCGEMVVGSHVHKNLLQGITELHLTSLVFAECTANSNDVTVVARSTDGSEWKLKWKTAKTFDVTNVLLELTFHSTGKVCYLATTGNNALTGTWVNGTPSRLTISGAALSVVGDCSATTGVNLPVKELRASGAPFLGIFVTHPP